MSGAEGPEGNGPLPDGEHPDLDRLSDLLAGLTDAAQAAGLSGHLRGCATCQGSVALLEHTRRLLAATPAVAMPDLVAARIDRALAAERKAAPEGTVGTAPAPAAVLPGPGRPQLGRRRAPGLATIAAVAAGFALIAAAVAGVLRLNASGPTSHASAADRVNNLPSFLELSTTRDFTAGTLRTAVPQLLAGDVGTATRLPMVAASVTAGPPNFTAGTAARLRDPRALFACIGQLTQGGPVVVPKVVAFARFRGHPAVIIVLPTPGDTRQLDVWVVGAGCTGTNADLLQWLRVPQPLP